jgi:hypothetical protein
MGEEQWPIEGERLLLSELEKMIARDQVRHGVQHWRKTSRYYGGEDPKRAKVTCKRCKAELLVIFPEAGGQFVTFKNFKRIKPHTAERAIEPDPDGEMREVPLANGKTRKVRHRLHEQQLDPVVIAGGGGIRVTDMAAKIIDVIGVKPVMHTLQQRIARIRLDMSPLDEWRQVPDFVRMLRIRGYAADYGTGDDGRIAFLAIVLAGAKEFIASEGRCV